MVQDHDAVAEAHDQGHVVFDDQQGGPQAPQLLQQDHEVLGLPGIEAGGGLIQQQQLRPQSQGPADLQAALVAVSQGIGRPVAFALQPHQAEQLQGAPCGLGLGPPHLGQGQ